MSRVVICWKLLAILLYGLHLKRRTRKFWISYLQVDDVKDKYYILILFYPSSSHCADAKSLSLTQRTGFDAPQCQPSIMRNLRSGNPGLESQQRQGDSMCYHTSPRNWSDDFSPQSADKWNWGQKSVGEPRSYNLISPLLTWFSLCSTRRTWRQGLVTGPHYRVLDWSRARIQWPTSSQWRKHSSLTPHTYSD